MYLDAIASLDAECEKVQAGINEWAKSADGKLCSKLLTPRNKYIANPTAFPPLTDKDEERFFEVDKVWSEKQGLKKMFEKSRTEVRDAMNKYLSQQKKDNKSVFGALDRHWKDNGKDRAAYHGGKWNGKDSRDIMSDPSKYYIYLVNQHGKRGPYKKKSKSTLIESTPPVYRPQESRAVTMSAAARAGTSRASELQIEVERLISTAPNHSPAKRQRVSPEFQMKIDGTAREEIERHFDKVYCAMVEEARMDV